MVLAGYLHGKQQQPLSQRPTRWSLTVWTKQASGCDLLFCGDLAILMPRLTSQHATVRSKQVNPDTNSLQAHCAVSWVFCCPEQLWLVKRNTTKSGYFSTLNSGRGKYNFKCVRTCFFRKKRQPYFVHTAGLVQVMSMLDASLRQRVSKKWYMTSPIWQTFLSKANTEWNSVTELNLLIIQLTKCSVLVWFRWMDCHSLMQSTSQLTSREMLRT